MNDMEISTIGERIKTLRKKRGYNQKELADLLGKSLRTIQKYRLIMTAGSAPLPLTEKIKQLI